MVGLDLDRRLREILINVTKETSLSSAAAIAELGFPAKVAFALVFETLAAKDKQAAEK